MKYWQSITHAVRSLLFDFQSAPALAGRRFYALDVSRGIAALAVVVFHWATFSVVKGDVSTANSDNLPFAAVLNIFYDYGELAVWYFFVLSGFIFTWLYSEGIADKTVSFKRFLLQRFARLYPLHLITLCFVAAMQLVYFGQHGSYFFFDANDGYHFFLNTLFIQYWGLQQGLSFNGPSWSVSVEVSLYLLFFIFALCKIRGLLLYLFIVVSVLVLQKSMVSTVLSMSKAFFIGGCIFYLANYVIRDGYLKIVPALLAALGVSWFLALTCYYLDFDLPGVFSSIGLLRFLLYYLFPLTVVSLFLWEFFNKNLMYSLRWLGDISYTVYLLHFPLLLLMVLISRFTIIPEDFHFSPWYFIFYLTILIIVCYWVHTGFERPLQRWILQRMSPMGRS